MTELDDRIARLSPQKRALLESRLKQRGLALPDTLFTQGTPTGSTRSFSFAQERLWFLSQLEPDSPVYNINRAVHLQGALDCPALEKALRGVVARHEVLRTRMPKRDGMPASEIARDKSPEIVLVDLSGRGHSAGDDSVRQLLARKAAEPFDLACDLMIRAALLRLSAEEHILLLTMHHIASDAWSVGVLCRELAELYTAAVEARSPSLPPLSQQYADWAQRQRQWLNDRVLRRCLEYWGRQLSDSPSLIGLPTDHPRPARQSHRGAWQAFSLDATLTAGLRRLSAKEGCTLFITLLTALQTLLYRYTGQLDICVATPVANREQEDTRQLIGFFVNTLVLRTRLSGDPTFRQLLGRVREVALEAYAHQDLPFERLVAELHPERSLSHSPLFQVMLVFHSEPAVCLRLPGLKSRPAPVHTGTSKFDLTLSITDAGEHLRAWLEYSTDLFEAPTVRRMASHYQALLEAAVANPDQPISGLVMLTEPERRQLLWEWNDTAAARPSVCIHELFEAQAERTPDRPAVTQGQRQVSYSVLNQRANRLADELRRLGVGPEIPVAICVERSPAMLVGILAILKAGGAYVPLDPTYPADRLAFMLEDCRVPVLLTQNHLLPRLPGHRGRIICLNWEGSNRPGKPANPVRQVTPENLAYIIYTSGSTGQPKGVCIEHRNTVALLHWARQAFEQDDLAGVLASTSLSFDLSVFEIFAPLSWGGTVALVDDVLRWPDAPLAGKVTLVTTVPSAMKELLRGGKLPPSVRVINLAGERLETSLVNEVFERTTVERVNDLYGPTECTTFSTYAPRTAHGPPIIGRPITNTQAYILDVHQQPVPVGVAGELYLGGAGVARGYLGRPALTAERFVPNPFSGRPGAHLYRTGDLARYRADGNIEFLGRLDNQVKVRGFRIELGEIEAVLREHPGVRDAAVTVYTDTAGYPRLAAYWTPKASGAPDVEDLRRFLQLKLPDYEVPSDYVRLDALPLSPVGKLDRRALPAPGAPTPKGVVINPRDPLEVELTRIWEGVLSVRPVGVTDNFFDLGGHSLLAVSLFEQIARVFGRQLPLATLFEAPTIERLARELREEERQPRWSALVPIQPAGSRPPLFCIHAVHGNVLFYAPLARCLGPDQPVYGLQLIGRDGRRDPLARVEEMAATYLSEMLTVQPQGPYFLAGFCVGAYIALEMACQLRQQGRQVGLLVSFNTDGQWKVVQSLVEHLRYHWQHLRRMRAREKLDYGCSRLRYRIGRMRNVLLHKVFKWYSGKSRSLPLWLLDVHIEEVNRQAARRYRPPIYDGRIVYFQGHADAFHDPSPFWRDLVGATLDIQLTPGSGVTIFREPHVRFLAERLKPYLEEARLSG